MNREQKRNDCILIGRIARRALKKLPELGSQISLVMDIEFTHEQHPLRLSELLTANDMDFFHDVCGIYTHFNRETKTLDGIFEPRFAA